MAGALHIEAQADRSEVVAGESSDLHVEERRRAHVPGEFGKPSLVMPPGWSVAKEEPESGSAVRLTVAIPKDAQTPRSPHDWMLPWPAPLVQARVHAVVEGYAFDVTAPVIAQRATSTRLDTLPLTLAPAVTLALEPRQFVLPEKRPLRSSAKRLEVLARVHYYGAGAAKVPVGSVAPLAGWEEQPPELQSRHYF